MKEAFNNLQETIGYFFKEENLLYKAMSHTSFTNERHISKIKSNERLEFLGDAVLELITSEFLYHKYPQMPEGELTKLRASMVCEPALAFCAKEIGLGEHLMLGKGEELTGGRVRDSITSDALEALIGAIYLDGGFANAKDFIFRFVLNDLDQKKLFYDSKTILQETVQGNMATNVSYKLLSEEGPDHNKTFSVGVYVHETCYATGKGRTKKAAEQEAAYKMLLELKKTVKK